MQLKRAYVISVNEGVLASTLTSSSFNQYIFSGRMTLMQEVSAVELLSLDLPGPAALTAAFQLFRRRRMRSLHKCSWLIIIMISKARYIYNWFKLYILLVLIIMLIWSDAWHKTWLITFQLTIRRVIHLLKICGVQTITSSNVAAPDGTCRHDAKFPLKIIF